MIDCEWCGRPLDGALLCHRPGCALPAPSERADRLLLVAGIGLVCATLVGIIVQILRGLP